MAVTYTAGSTADRDRLRLLIGDTDVIADADALYQDAELDDLLLIEGSVNLAGALAFEILAGRVAGEYDFTADGASFRRGSSAGSYMSRAKQLRARGAGVAVTHIQRIDGYSDDVSSEEVNVGAGSTFDRPELSR